MLLCKWVLSASSLAISDRAFELGSGKGVYNMQIVLSRISTITPQIIPLLVIDFCGGFWDSVLFSDSG